MPKKIEPLKRSNFQPKTQSTPVRLVLPQAHQKQYELINAFELHADKHVRFVAGACGTKFGKAVNSLESTLTTNGMKKHGDIQVGDYVFGADGKPTKVVWISGPQYNRPCYEIEFTDGEIITVDEEHLWETRTWLERRSNDRFSTNRKGLRTTKDIYESLMFRNRPNHSVDVAMSIELLEQSFILDPYVLGVWLGDGNCGSSTIAGIDQQIFDILEEIGFSCYKNLDGQSQTAKTLITVIKSLGLYGNKHIPTKYLHGSIEQRMSLLQGLMDTDGTVGKRGYCCFDNTNENLADGVAFLCSSLGIKVSRYIKQGTLYGVKHKLVHRVHFTTNLPVFRLQRKLVRLPKLTSVRNNRRLIVDVRPVKSVIVNCIEVDNLNHLYCVGKSLIPTHNTYGCAIRIVKEAWENEHSLNWWVAPVHDQADIAFQKVQELLPEGMYKVHKADKRITILNPDGTDRSVIAFKSAENEGNLRGPAVNFFIIDEAARVTYQAFVSVLTTTTQTRGRGIVISTPMGRNWFYNVYQWGNKLLSDGVTAKYDCPDDDRHPEWMSIRMPTWSNPYVPAESIEEARKQVPEDVFKQEYGAEFLDESAGVFRNIRGCIKGSLDLAPVPEPFHSYVMGVDLARHRDYTVLTVMDRATKHVVEMARFNQMDWASQYQRIVEMSYKWNRALCVVDSTGIGDPIVETLQNVGLPVEPYKISGNLAKRQLVEKTRVALEQNRISYLPYVDLIRELEAFTMTTSPSGTLQYSAPDGEHDDTVISLCLAVWVVDNVPMVYKFIKVRGY